jgi:hypothetical protein
MTPSSNQRPASSFSPSSKKPVVDLIIADRDRLRIARHHHSGVVLLPVATPIVVVRPTATTPSTRLVDLALHGLAERQQLVAAEPLDLDQPVALVAGVAVRA